MPSKSKSKSKRSPGNPGKPILDPVSVAAALAELKGNISAVAARIGVSRSAVQQLVAKNENLQAVLTDAREGMKDNAESSLYRSVIAGEAWAVCFFLKTQAKDRGYIERQEVESIAKTRLVIEEEIVGGNRHSEGATPPGTS